MHLGSEAWELLQGMVDTAPSPKHARRALLMGLQASALKVEKPLPSSHALCDNCAVLGLGKRFGIWCEGSLSVDAVVWLLTYAALLILMLPLAPPDNIYLNSQDCKTAKDSSGMLKEVACAWHGWRGCLSWALTLSLSCPALQLKVFTLRALRYSDLDVPGVCIRVEKGTPRRKQHHCAFLLMSPPPPPLPSPLPPPSRLLPTE